MSNICLLWGPFLKIALVLDLFIGSIELPIYVVLVKSNSQLGQILK